MDMPKYNFWGNNDGKSGIRFSMDVFNDLHDPKFITKDKEEISRNSSKIYNFKYRAYNNDPIKNAEHALNLIYFSPYLLQTKGEEYVDFLTRPITSQHAEILYSDNPENSDNTNS
jgi:hypothetical protein